MTAVDWDEVKRLAADFQRAQLSTSAQTLSERNCIEIINKLIELNLLDVIFTSDGKEYITPQYLIKEIKDELYVNGGRVNLIELSKSLNVDLSHVSAKATEIEKSSSGCQILNGQLIDRSYTNTVAGEVNERLKTHGKVNIADLTKQYDLPSDFLQSIVEKNLGKLVQGKQDKVDRGLFYTEAFVERNKCIVRGALTALTQPTSVSTILQATELQEREFYAAFEVLHDEKIIAGALTAKQGMNTMYIPHVYTKQQSEWVDNFFKQNGYLEYDALSRLGISDAVNFIRRHFPNAGIVELASVAIGSQLISQVNDSIEETIISGSYVDLTMLLPSVFDAEDVSRILSSSLKKLKSKTPLHTFCDTILVTEKFLNDLAEPFLQDIVKKRALECVQSGTYLKSLIEKKMAKGGGETEDTKVDKKEERRKKAAGGKGGGGTQGRETKTKSTKKKNVPHKGGRGGDDSDDEMEKKNSSKPVGHLEFLTVEEIEEIVAKSPALSDEEGTELAAAISSYLHPILNKACSVAAEEEYNRSLLSSAGDKRKRRMELQDKIDSAIIEIRLADRGLKSLGPAPSDLQGRLTTHLMKTLATDIVNQICLDISESNQPITTEMRNKIINETTGEAKDPLQKLNKSLASSVDEFLNCLDIALPHVDLMSRKSDKKKEKNFLLNRRETMLSEMAQCDDPAAVLHLTVLLLLQYMTSAVVHGSPKFVQALLPTLKTFLSEEDYRELCSFQDQVLKLLTSEDKEDQNQIKSQLNEKVQSIRNIAINYKKQGIEK